MTTLNFLEECKKLGKEGKVALIEAGKEGERCGASRWTMAYLRLDKGEAHTGSSLITTPEQC